MTPLRGIWLHPPLPAARTDKPLPATEERDWVGRHSGFILSTPPFTYVTHDMEVHVTGFLKPTLLIW